MNLADKIFSYGETNPFASAILIPRDSGTETITYQQLSRYMDNAGKRAMDCGIHRDQIVALVIKDPVLNISLLLGLMRLGIVTISAHELNLPQGLETGTVLTDFADLSGTGRSWERIDKGWLLGNSRPSKTSDHVPVSLSDCCQLFLTSGSTGEAKAVAITYARMLDRVMRPVWGTQFLECPGALIGLGFSTMPGFLTLLYELATARTVLLPARTPEATLQAIVAHNTEAMIAAPKGLSEMAKVADRVPGVTSKLKVVVSTGSLLERGLSERIQRSLCENLVTNYATTELAGIATAPMIRLVKTPGAVGYVMPGVEVEILDHNGEILPLGGEGRIRVRSRFAAAGYTSKGLREIESFPNIGLCPGDIGFFASDGMLVLTGRSEHVLNLGGSKVSPERVESVLTNFPGMHDAGVFAFSNELGIDRMVAAVAFEGTDASTLRDELKSYLHKSLPPDHVPTIILRVGEVPRNHMGKIDRDELKKRGLEILSKSKLNHGS